MLAIPERVREATYQVLNESIADFHKTGFVHGDLREANVKLREGGKKVLLSLILTGLERLELPNIHCG